MNDMLQPLPVRPTLPEPERERWQPLRLGLVELFHYDSEEFWFRDGHLLLRGNNGTGKSKVLSLTLPFLFDAQLRSSRIEPDGDSGKKMAWNLLVGSYQRRTGYTWIEFGRRTVDGSTHYFTLGAGLSAVAGRAQVESWFFLLDDARIGEDIWLTSDQRAVLTRERLREAIAGHGQVFEHNATAYRRAVDERLFNLGAQRYAALMDTLIQLRQPQLSKKPDEAGLSHALTEALPPLAPELLADVADALNQLEEDRRQLDELRELARAVERFDQRYRIYAGVLTRRQARELRHAQTDFDNASRERNRAHAEQQSAQAGESTAREAHQQAERELAAARRRLETLQSNPTMQDANRLELAEKDANKRRQEAATAREARDRTEQQLRREEKLSQECGQRLEQAGQALLAARRECADYAGTAGVALFAEHPFAAATTEALAALSESTIEAAAAALRDAIGARREQIALLAQRHQTVRELGALATQRQALQLERLAESEEAATRREAADTAVEEAGQALVDAWAAHCAGLAQLRFDAEQPLIALGEWVADPGGDNPARHALHLAQTETSHRLATRQLELKTLRDTLQRETDALTAEREALLAGKDAEPPPPPTRAIAARHALAGAPLWQLVDFQDHVDAAQRAGLEAALEASGLLDAWVAPDGALLAADNTTRLDTQWTLRPAVHGISLAAWLRSDMPADSPVSAGLLANLLSGIGGAADDACEAWIATDGRFRLGSLTGAWHKPQAIYIGHTARAEARRRRFDEVAQRLAQLEQEQAGVSQRFAQLEADRTQAEREWHEAPSEQALRTALSHASACAREFQTAQQRLEQANAALRDAENDLRAARETLERDATDMQLPMDASALPAVDAALHDFNDRQHQLLRAIHDLRRALTDLDQQRARETGARTQWQERDEALAAANIEAEDAQTHFETLRDSVGTQVDELRRQLADTRLATEAADEARKKCDDEYRVASRQAAVAASQAQTAEGLLDQCTQARATAIAHLQRFAASSLLASALPDLELPAQDSDWTIDPALTLARRIEQALAAIADDDANWTRVQKQTAEDLQELQRALTALGHQAPAEPSDWGLVVHIIFNNRPERPDRLVARLADDIAQRNELLSASERTVLENHLQAEIAAEVQRLLRAAEQQVVNINRELHKRPTSTGVRYRLQWQPLGVEDGAPAGLDIARERLLNTSADLWSAEDRRVIGVMLQQRIAAERERADTDPGPGGDGNLKDQLARALDYRRWHQFRVQRFQDGNWRKLSGPASSGERALGLTVPLFAAIASFYSQGSNPLAPRLMLLDEAFAGIDDAARAHCMGLIREFDLDFVITSEREWACYAELPGVSICQLQRHEGIDAVHVSRWTWDGRGRHREEDPDRRFPPA